MSALTIQFSDSLKLEVERLARVDGVSVDAFLALAAAEKISALETGNYLARRAGHPFRLRPTAI